MIAININEPWISMILEGKKTIETRTHPQLSRFLGQDVALCRTPGGMIVGTAHVYGSCVYLCKQSFRKDEYRHCIKEGSEYDWKDTDEKKYGCMLSNIKPCEPYKANVVTECISYKIIK